MTFFNKLEKKPITNKKVETSHSSR